MRDSDLAKFIKARERHRVAKIGGWRTSAKPDPIISKYRFCNVRRNDDAVTEWIQRRFFAEWRNDPHLWFALVVARLFNNPASLAAFMPFILPFKPEKLRDLAKRMAAKDQRIFNAAYIVSTNGRRMNKVDYVIDIVLGPLWTNRKKLTSMLNVGQLANAHMVLQDQQGLGSFMAAQVLADLKYANPTKWEDFHTFAASGPGSRRGLNRVMGFATKTPWRESIFRGTLATLRDRVNAKLAMDPITAQDLQNCLCEFDKYERARLGEGRPKQQYKPAENPWAD